MTDELRTGLANYGREPVADAFGWVAIGRAGAASPADALVPGEDPLNQFASEERPVLQGERAIDERPSVQDDEAVEQHRILHHEATTTASRLLQQHLAVAPFVASTRARRALSVALLTLVGAGVSLGAPAYGRYWFAGHIGATPAVIATVATSQAAASPTVLPISVRTATAAEDDDVRGRAPLPVAVTRTRESTALPHGNDKAAAHDQPATALILPVTDGAFSPSFAATGSALFFHSGRKQAGRLLEATLDDHGVPLRIVPVLEGPAQNHHPRVSRDDRQIAFDSDREGERGVYVADRAGTNVRRVSGPGFAAFPSWSPDMKWLAFVRAEPARPHVWNLWLRNMESGELKRLTSYRVGQTWTASWFPDAHRLSYSHEDQLVVLDVATGESEILASPVAGKLVRTPAVSPDGKRIVFQVFRHGVWIVDLASHSMHEILDDPTAEEFAWNPGGSRLAYHSRRDGEWRIWVTPVPS